MSNALAIATVTAVLQDLLQSALVNAPAVERLDGADVVSAYPGPENQGAGVPKPRVSIYLYQVTPNAALRGADLPTRPDRVALDLHYLLSFYGNEDTWEPQRLLAIVMRALSANAVLTRAGIDRSVANVARVNAKRFLAASDLSKAVELVKFTVAQLSLEEMTRLWSVFFQTKYALSVAYQCSVVVIDNAEPPPAGPPVLNRTVTVVPLARPSIERVVASANPDAAILSASEVSVLGDNLSGPTTLVRVGGIEVTALIEASPARLRFTLPPGLRAGVQGLQVVHRLLLGIPPTPHPGPDSSPVAFLLSPALATLRRTAPTGTQTTTVCTATFSPPASRTQDVALLLRPGTASAQPQVFSSPPRNRASDPAETTTIAFTVSNDIVAGRYFASLLVDGAESPLLSVVLT